MRCCSSRVFLLVTFCLVTANLFASEQFTFNQFIQQIKSEAHAKGISTKTIHITLNHVQHLQHVLVKDKAQKGHMTFAAYKAKSLPEIRIQRGHEKLKRYRSLLHAIAKKYQVQPQYIVALWGLESNYGKNMGDVPEFSALATLAYNKRRGDYFKRQLFAALEMVDKDLAPMKNMHGSWAGAMGQCQFMPMDFLRLAVDYDHDGKKDIWHSTPDALASIANFLYQSGWNNKMEVVYPVNLTKYIPAEYIGFKTKLTLANWHKKGVEIVNHHVRSQGKFSLFIPDNDKKNAFLVYRHNYDILFEWNHSHSYALVVGLLANRV